jgi:methylated-DNA-[protein]-cysteine S-methyltransferase
MTIIDIAEFASPIGEITVAVRDGHVCALSFTDRWPQRRVQLEKRFRQVTFRHVNDSAEVLCRVGDYFAGDLRALAAIEVDPGGTPFQERVWRELRNVAAAQTISYGELARRIGSPAACRAVGAANGANPVAIVIPCHRVIGTQGHLTGYGGGIERKRWLLDHERRVVGHDVLRPAV